jgi:hypothetical protein
LVVCGIAVGIFTGGADIAKSGILSTIGNLISWITVRIFTGRANVAKLPFSWLISGITVGIFTGGAGAIGVSFCPVVA